MPLDLLRSPSAFDAFLMFLLLAWLGGSATMTIVTSLAGRRQSAAYAPQAAPTGEPAQIAQPGQSAR